MRLRNVNNVTQKRIVTSYATREYLTTSFGGRGHLFSFKYMSNNVSVVLNKNLCLILFGLRTQYKVSTAQAMAKMSEREFSFELVEKILDWIREQPEHGSVLVFLPGWNHIFALQKYLQQHPIYGLFLKF